MISDTEIAAIRSNLFWASHTAIPDWQTFPWHRNRRGDARIQTQKGHSSQALAIDVFGTIKVNVDRDLILSAVARRCAIPDEGPWTVELEKTTPKELLGEPTATQVDVMVSGPRSIMVIEAKFTEAGGNCGQTKPISGGANNGIRQCNGTYAMQRNEANGYVARCALTLKGIRYWESIPEVFGVDAMTDMRPCPFAQDAYQWMRNVVVAHQLAKLENKVTATVAAFAAGNFQTAKKVKSGGLGLLPASGTAAVIPLSYQEIVALAKTHSSSPRLWDELGRWINVKIANAQKS